MPIYEYECGACGESHEFIQKFSDGPKRKCPSCGALKLKKQISAAAFHLKGDGWYVTDFRDKDKKDTKEKKSDSSSGDSKSTSESSDTKSSDSKSDSGSKKKADKKKGSKSSGAGASAS